MPIQRDSFKLEHSFGELGIDRFLEEAERFVQQGFIDTGIDLVYDAVDELLRGGQFALCDSILSKTQATKHSDDILLAMLTATLPASSRLASRQWFLSQVVQVLRERGELNVALLAGLES